MAKTKKIFDQSLSWLPEIYKQFIIRHARIVKFLVSGGLATFTNLAILYIMVDFIGIWYLFSAGAAFVISFFVSFSLQKFWTFGNLHKDLIIKQMTLYLLLAGINFVANIFFMWLLVEIFHWWYMLAQTVIYLLMSVSNYLIYKFIIFKNIEPKMAM